MSPRAWIGLLVVAALALGCKQAEESGEMEAPAVDMAAEVQAIHDLEERYMQAFEARDVDAVLALHTADAMEIAHDGTAEPSSNSVRTQLESAPPGTTISIDSEETSVSAAGDVAYDVGTYTMTVPDPQGGVSETYRYVAGFRKEDGVWKVAVVIGTAALGAPPGQDTMAMPADAPTGP